MAGLSVEVGSGTSLRPVIRDKVGAMEKLRAEVVDVLGRKHVEHFLGIYDLMFFCFTENVELNINNRDLRVSVDTLSRRINRVVLNMDEVVQDLKALRIVTSDLADSLAEKFLAEEEVVTPLPWYRRFFKGRK